MEPFFPNILRLHKATTIDNTQKRITLIQNAISDKRNVIQALSAAEHNLGGQG